MVKLILLFLFISLSATAQKAKPLTLKYVNARIDSLVGLEKKRSAITTDMLYAQYKVDQESKKILIAKVDTLINEMSLLRVQKRDANKYNTIYIIADSTIIKKIK